MNRNDMKKEIETRINSNESVLFRITPGTGHSNQLRNICDELGLKFKYIYAPAMECIKLSNPSWDEVSERVVREMSDSDVIILDRIDQMYLDDAIEKDLENLIVNRTVNDGKLKTTKSIFAISGTKDNSCSAYNFFDREVVLS